jgi:Asp-tRNA(Asn)/Glu-tRNA(Gln) amidotransferase A subunit family amidase
MTEPFQLSALDALSEMKTGNLSPVELFDSCLQRIESVNPVVNAVVAMDVDAGRQQALEAEEKYRKGKDIRLLEGLPVGIKDLDATANLATTWGSLIYKDHVPQQDDPMVARVREHGANIFSKTNTPEFGAGGNTKNRVYGTTCNPFDTDKTCAGSSGGTAVALATDMLPSATGSDYGGSLRTPASFCGITGFRPSPGQVSYPNSAMALNPFSVLGPMGRNVADTHLLLRAQVQVDRRDPFSAAAATIPETLEPVDLQTVRAAISTDLNCCPVDNKIASIFSARTDQFKGLFREYSETAPELPHVHEVFEVLRGVVFAAAHRENLQKYRDQIGENVIDNTDRGLALTAEQISTAYARQSVVYRNMLNFFDDVDVLICPAAAVSPYPHAQNAVTEINGTEMETYMRWLALSYAPTSALCCSCVLPCGVDHLGMPFGIQVVGPNGADAKVLAIAASLEAELERMDDTKRPLPDISALLS